MMASSGDGIQLRTIDLPTGIRLRVAEAGSAGQPLVLFLHGWPESWYSWRHQLRCGELARDHYLVAPDLRGFGSGSSRPFSPADYTVHHVASDLLLLLQELGYAHCLLVGHDWGAVLTWMLLVLHPTVFRAAFVLSVPHAPWNATSPTAMWKHRHGDNFFYILYHCELPDPNQKGPAESEYDEHCAELLYRLYTSPSVAKQPPVCQDPKRSAGGWLDRLPRPVSLPSWLSADDLAYFVAEYRAAGFRGGVNYYRNFDANWYLMAPHRAQPIAQPVAFVAGRQDLVMEMYGGVKSVAAIMHAGIPHAELHFLDDCGHWTQQEKHADVNALLVDFVRRNPTSPRARF